MHNALDRTTPEPRVGWAGAAYLAISAIGIAVYASVAAGVARDALFVALSAAAAAAIFLGIRRNRPRVTRAWFALGLALALTSAGNLLALATTITAVTALREFADLLFMVCYLPLFIAAYRFGRGPQKLDGAAFLDAGIVGLAAIPLVWQFVVEPNIVGGVSEWVAAMALAVPVVDTVLVSLAVPLILLRFSRSPSALLLVAGLSALSLGDSAYAIASLTKGGGGVSVNTVIWLVAYVLLASAALVPSASRLGAAVDHLHSPRDRTRLVVLGAALLVSPFVTIIATARHGYADLALLAFLALALACLVIVRFVRTLGQVMAADQRAIDARRESELELAQLGTAIGNATDAVIITDVEGRITYVNPAFELMTGFLAAEVKGNWQTDGQGGEAFARAIRTAHATSAGWHGDIISWRKDGSDVIGETSISAIAGNGGPAMGFVTISRDVTQERKASRVEERRARERALVAETLGALHAGLTPEETARAVCEQVIKLPEAGVATVLTFGRNGIATVLEQADREGGGSSNVEIGPARSAYLRDRATNGPWVELWLPEADRPHAQRFAELGIMANAYAPIVVGGVPIGLLALGSDMIDAVDRLAERLPALIEFAAITGTLLGGAVADRLATEVRQAQMRLVIERGDFFPVFQPIVDLATGEVRGYEALTRFTDKTAPDVRFEEAHRLGVGIALERACLQASFLASKRLPVGPWLNVNVTPQMILAGLVEGLLPAGDRPIILEITEHEAITDYAAFRTAMEPMRGRVRIAVDDAGAGFASLRHIVELAPAMVKLDRSLVARIDVDKSREAMVAGMVRFTEGAGLVLLAEGIETNGELATLRRLGVELGQGYLLGMPATIDALMAQLEPIAA